MFYVYILQSGSTNRYYIGSTNDLARRLNDHNRGKTVSTKHKGPWLLIHHEVYGSRSEAVLREKHIKLYKGGQAFKQLIIK